MKVGPGSDPVFLKQICSKKNMQKQAKNLPAVFSFCKQYNRFPYFGNDPACHRKELVCQATNTS